jgi:flagellar hook-associated protein 3 FlgL
MRVTTSMMVRSTLRDLSASLSRLQTTQTRLSTGRQLTKASDDPTLSSDAMGLRRQMSRADQRSRALSDATGWLGAADTALTSALDRLGRAKEIAVRAANTGSIPDANARLALATEIRAIRDDLIGIANTTYGDRRIFSGTAAGDAYDSSGTYLGDGASIARDVAERTTMVVNVTGPAVVGVGGGPVGNVFEVLDRLATAVAAGNAVGIANEHANLDTATSTVGSATVEVGSRAARLEVVRVRADDEALQLRSRLSAVEDVDVVDALITAKAQEASYQAALQVAAKILPPSLLDYLR